MAADDTRVDVCRCPPGPHPAHPEREKIAEHYRRRFMLGVNQKPLVNIGSVA